MTNTTAQMAAADAAVREYCRAVLRRNLADEEARQTRIRELEKAGHRFISGGQTSSGDDEVQTWAITDWRTGDLIVHGAGGIEAYDATAARLDPDGKWLHIDTVDEGGAPVEFPGIPASLADFLQDWLGAAPDEDVASFVGWSVEEVARHREEA